MTIPFLCWYKWNTADVTLFRFILQILFDFCMLGGFTQRFLQEAKDSAHSSRHRPGVMSTSEADPWQCSPVFTACWVRHIRSHASSHLMHFSEDREEGKGGKWGKKGDGFSSIKKKIASDKDQMHWKAEPIASLNQRQIPQVSPDSVLWPWLSWTLPLADLTLKLTKVGGRLSLFFLSFIFFLLFWFWIVLDIYICFLLGKLISL